MSTIRSALRFGSRALRPLSNPNRLYHRLPVNGLHQYQFIGTRGISCSRQLFAEETPKADPSTSDPEQKTTTEKDTKEEENPEEEEDLRTPEQKKIDEQDLQIAELEEKLKAAQDRHLRGLAEQQNVRNRALKDVESARNFALQGFSKDLLEIDDTLTMAINSVSKALEEDDNPKLKQLHEGVVMTQNILLKVFNKNGVTKLDPLGEVFDPNFHDCAFMFPDPNQTPGTVGMVHRIGWSLNGRVLRPAQVGVVQESPQAAKEE